MMRWLWMSVALALLSPSTAAADTRKNKPEAEMSAAERARFEKMKISTDEADQIRKEMQADLNKGKAPTDKAGSLQNKLGAGGKLTKAKGAGEKNKGLTTKADGLVSKGKGLDTKSKVGGAGLVNKAKRTGATATDKLNDKSKKKPGKRSDFIPPAIDPTRD